MINVITLRAFGDNYVYLVEHRQGGVVAVDPGDSRVVLDALKDHALELDAVLITHNHHDHTGGVRKLKRKTGCRVIWPGDVPGGETVDIAGFKAGVISTPGHTQDSVCYYFEPAAEDEPGAVFTGDTLFIGGCGRVFGGSYDDMFESLRTLAGLSEDTAVYPGHDYTEENYRFALSVEPDNADVKEMLERIGTAGTDRPESTIGDEKRVNVFMRAANAEEFAKLRRMKDRF